LKAPQALGDNWAPNKLLHHWHPYTFHLKSTGQPALSHPQKPSIDLYHFEIVVCCFFAKVPILIVEDFD
jgi:hypothetical protein